MVIEIPTAEDFARATLATLNLAWDVAMGLCRRFRSAIKYEGHEEEEISDQYWSLAQRPLGHAVTLIHQSLELSLKSRIARVTPYLLIGFDISGLPKGQVDSIPFSEFKMLDAKDLIRVHDIFCDEKIGE